VTGPGPILICHVDGASHGNPGPAGAGAVVLDETGRERRRLAVPLGRATNNEAEYQALVEGLKAVADICREDKIDTRTVSVVVRTDSELVVKQLSGEYRSKSANLVPFIRTYRQMAGDFFRVTVAYGASEQDKRAHELATQAAQRSGQDNPAAPKAVSPAPAAPKAASPRYSRLDHLECSRCEERFDPARAYGPCPSCDGPLLAGYDLTGLTWPPTSSVVSRADGRHPGLRPEANSMWRYHELLPVTDPRFVVSLGEGLTPLVALGRIGERGDLEGLGRIWLKDEGQNPTGTFKARGASAAVSRLVELGLDRCAAATAGNAGSAFAAYSARAGIKFLAAMPRLTPDLIRAECASYGGDVELTDGLLPDAARSRT
jgi:ribonuclease HI